MVTFHLFSQAKAFLGWDKFPDLTIKLIPVQKAVGFYLSPENRLHTIILFYHARATEFTEPFFLLFHEAGHFLQFRKEENRDNNANYEKLVNQLKGTEKINFEIEAWKNGELLLREFLEKHELSIPGLMHELTEYQKNCLHSYLQD